MMTICVYVENILPERRSASNIQVSRGPDIGNRLGVVYDIFIFFCHILIIYLLFFYILPSGSVSDIQVLRGRDNWNRPGLVDDHEKDDENERKL